MKPLTNVVMTSWNAVEYTKNAIDRLFATVPEPYYLTIVDNGSDEATIAYIRQLKPKGSCVDIVKIFNTDNMGPGYAINQGYRASGELDVDYTCLVNNDVYFQSNWLAVLEEKMNIDSSLGAVAAMRPSVDVKHHIMRDVNAKDVADAVDEDSSIQDQLTYFFGEDVDQGFSDIIRVNGGGVEEVSFPDAIVTCCALMRNSAADEIGFMADPMYEVYGSEDIDYTWELNKRGYRAVVAKDVYTHHFRHRSSNDNKLDRDKCLRINNQKLFDKWSAEILDVTRSYLSRGFALADLYENETNREFWFLRRVNDIVGFYENGVLREDKFKK